VHESLFMEALKKTGLFGTSEVYANEYLVLPRRIFVLILDVQSGTLVKLLLLASPVEIGNSKSTS
jgi:hypothetical protein